jgi:hypothetical protein
MRQLIQANTHCLLSKTSVKHLEYTADTIIYSIRSIFELFRAFRRCQLDQLQRFDYRITHLHGADFGGAFRVNITSAHALR